MSEKKTFQYTPPVLFNGNWVEPGFVPKPY